MDALVGVKATPDDVALLMSGSSGKPTAKQAWRNASRIGIAAASGWRRITIGPVEPCPGASPRSRSVSALMNKGRTSR